jgi:hypothetical protein
MGQACKNCGQTVDAAYRFCPWCAAAQERKAVAMFPPHPDVDASGRGLRVSRYFDPEDGPPHTRLSIYGDEGKVTAVVALDDEQTIRLARFLASLTSPVASSSRLVDRLLGR